MYTMATTQDTSTTKTPRRTHKDRMAPNRRRAPQGIAIQPPGFSVPDSPPQRPHLPPRLSAPTASPTLRPKGLIVASDPPIWMARPNLCGMGWRNTLAREMRGVLSVLVVAGLIVWSYDRISDDRDAAKERLALEDAPTSTTEASTTTTTTPVQDVDRFCIIATSFREDLAGLEINLVDPSGEPVDEDEPKIDIGLSDEEAEDQEDFAQPPQTIRRSRIDPVASGLLPKPQQLALNFYTTAATLRLGPVDADFDAMASYHDEVVNFGEEHDWDIDEIEASATGDRWQALTTRVPIGVQETLDYTLDTCDVSIGTGFIYQEPRQALEEVTESTVFRPVDPSAIPSAGRAPTPSGG